MGWNEHVVLLFNSQELYEIFVGIWSTVPDKPVHNHDIYCISMFLYCMTWVMEVQLWAAVSSLCGFRCIIVLTLLSFQIRLEGGAVEDGHQNTGRVSPFSDPWEWYLILLVFNPDDPHRCPSLRFSVAEHMPQFFCFFFTSSLKKRSLITTTLHLFKCWQMTHFTKHKLLPLQQARRSSN